MNAGSGQGGAHGPSSLHNWWPADPRHTSSSTSDVMSQLCRVCGEPAAGFHFGAFTCEGCKSFFGRTYNNLSSISECKNNSECVINKKNRTSCKACRLRKCLVVGMSKSGSRYGRRSNWFKIHCLLQEQQQQHSQHAHPQHMQQLQPAGDGAVPLAVHFQQQHHQQQQQQQQQRQRPAVAVVDRPLLHDPGRTSPAPLSWADVKHHHMRLDADNNNSVAGDLNKDAGLRLSVSAAAAAAAAVQAVRPEMLRWPSPFFPTFPFPPPMPFFLAMQTSTPASLLPPPPPQSSSHHYRGTRYSPSSRSSSGEDDALPSPPKRIAIDRDLPPVQDSPMDLSVTAAVQPRSPRAPYSVSSRSPSPSDAGSGRRDSGNDDGRRRSSADGSSPTTAADRSRRHHRRRRRRRRRLRHDDDAAGRNRTSGSETESSGSSESPTVSTNGDERRQVKNSPMDLTCNRS